MIVVLLLALLLMGIVSGNNLSACSGVMISGKVVGKNTGIGITAVGYIAGLLMEGGFLRSSLLSGVPIISTEYAAVALASALLVFVISNLLRLPQSLSLVLASSAIGASLATGYYVSTGFAILMLSVWLAAPVISVFATMLLMAAARKAINKRHVWKTVRRIKAALIASSFLMAFVLGANTLGLIYAVMPNTQMNQFLAIAAIGLGSIFLSAGALRRIGNEIISIRYLNAAASQFVSSLIMEAATLFGIPVAGTEVLTSSIYGAGVSYRGRLMSWKTAWSITYEWVLTIVAGFAIAYVIGAVIVAI